MRIKWKKNGKVTTVTNELGRSLIADGLAWDVTHLPDPEHEQLIQALGLDEEE